MNKLKHLKRFNESEENLNVSDKSKYSIGDRVKIKQNLDDIIGVSGMYLSKGPKHPLYKAGDNDGMNDFLGKEAKIVYVVNDDDKSNDRNDFRFSRYLIDIDNGDYWWVDECFD
jgi:hypothetical protein